MNQYMLLRDGLEEGPYSLEELENKNLKSFDLVKTGGDSAPWQFLEEIDELRNIAGRSSTKPESRNDLEFSDRSSDGDSRFTEPLANQHSVHSLYLNDDTNNFNYNQSRYTAQEATGTKKPFLTNALKWTLLLVGIMIAGAFIVKKSMSGPKAIIEKNVPVANKGFIIPEDAAASISNDFQNAITKEFVMAEDSIKAAKKAKPINLKKQVELTSNNYKTKVFGGIDKLELTINNRSDILLDEITIQIDYLKRNGQVIQSEIVSEKNLKPKGEKIIKIAPSARGFKVAYKVVNVEAEAYKAAIQDI